MSNAWGRGSTTAWRRVRAIVLARDGGRCQLKLPGCSHHATHVHHTRGKAYGDDPAFLVAACPRCNLKTGAPTQDPAPTPRTQW